MVNGEVKEEGGDQQEPEAPEQAEEILITGRSRRVLLLVNGGTDEENAGTGAG